MCKTILFFFAPSLLKEELNKYNLKIAAYSKLNEPDLSLTKELVLSTINFISEESISRLSWLKAFELTKDIDEDDTPFVALAIELNTKQWTGDISLFKGLIKKRSIYNYYNYRFNKNDQIRLIWNTV